MKKIFYTAVTIILFFAITDVIIRVYLCLKYKEPQYLKFNAEINYQKGQYVVPEKLQIQGKIVNYKAGYYKLASGSFGYFRNRVFPFTINSLGFRNKEFTAEKQKGIKRICVLGSSSVWGHGLNDNETFPFYLSEYLGDRYEVINCGFPGYKMKEIYNLFAHEIISYNPDIVMIYEAYNDSFNPSIKTPPLLFLHDMLYYKWMLYTILLEKYSAIKHNTPLPFFYLHNEKIPDDYSKYLNSIVELARSKSIKVVLVKQPLSMIKDGVIREDSIPTLLQKYRKMSDSLMKGLIRNYYYSLEMENIALKQSSVLIDPISAMEGKGEFFLDEVHLTPDGASFLANFIAKRVTGNALPYPAYNGKITDSKGG